MKHARDTKVVIQIVTFNNAETIRACLRSVKNQKFKNYEPLVIDNASSDTTPAIVRSLGIRCLQNSTNVGYAAAHNLGFLASRSAYILTLNPDVQLRQDFLEKLMFEVARSPRSVGSAQPLLYRVDHMGDGSYIIDSAGLYMTPYRRQMLRYSGKDARALVLRKQDIFGPDGAAALYRRAMLEDIDLGQGVFDEDYFMHKEDVDVCWRAQLRGWRSIFVPNSVAYHIRTFRAGHRTHIDTNMRMLAIRNRYYLMTKNELPLLFIRDVLWIGMYDIAMFVYILCCEPKSVTAYRLFFESLSVLRMKRLLIQTRKRVGVRYMAQWFRWRYV